jgi:hypothetical protein
MTMSVLGRVPPSLADHRISELHGMKRLCDRCMLGALFKTIDEPGCILAGRFSPRLTSALP